MNASWRRLVACVAVVAASAGLALWLEAPKKKAASAAPPISRTANSALSSPLTDGVANVAAPGNVASAIAAAAASLRNADSPDTGLRQLNALRQALSALPAKEASAAIRHFLDSREDAPTRQGFKIGAKGLLDQAPSLRVFLLDYLERVDPAAAAAYARTILSSMDSPDEWAVALRNLAMGDDSPDARALLTQKTKEMFQNALWQQNPSVGFLEAFDMAVYSGGTELVPTLTELLRNPENPAVAHAAYLALDRLIISEPATLLAALEAEPDLMQGRELTRADYFARADVRDPQQRQVLENYLLDAHLGPAEADHFAGLYPSANYMISQNLLTPTPTPDHAALISRDAESLRVVQEWLADPRFANLRSQLQKVQTRLEQFTREANQGH